MTNDHRAYTLASVTPKFELENHCSLIAEIVNTTIDDGDDQLD